MANTASDYSAVSIPNGLLEEIRADTDELAKAQNHIKPVSLAEMIAITGRFYKQRVK